MILVAALLMLLSIAWVGIAPHRAFLPLLKQMSYGQSTWAQFGEAFYRDPYNQSLNSFFHHILVPWPGMRPWVPLGPGWANLLTGVAFLLCVAAVVWRTWPFGNARSVARASRPWFPKSSRCADPAILFALFILLSLLTPSIYWDHYAVIALWPLFACYARLPRHIRPWSTALMVSLALLLGGVLELTPLRGAVLGVATAVMATGLLRQGCRPALMDPACDGLKTALHTKWQDPAALMDPACDGLKTALHTKWQDPAALTDATCDGLKTALHTKWQDPAALTDATCDGLKTALHTKWQDQPVLMGAAWSLAGACLLARFPYGYPFFHQGLGLIPMSLVLWGTLILFGLCLMMVSIPVVSKNEDIKQKPPQSFMSL
jgi:hypothetical protein